MANLLDKAESVLSAAGGALAQVRQAVSTPGTPVSGQTVQSSAGQYGANVPTKTVVSNPQPATGFASKVPGWLWVVGVPFVLAIIVVGIIAGMSGRKSRRYE